MISPKELFNFSAREYDKHMACSGHYKAQSNILKKLLPLIKEPIIDLACGSGFLLTRLKEKFTLIYANDYSPEMIVLTRRKTNNCARTYSLDDAAILSSYLQKFSTIICCNLFFYLQDYRKAIQRWKELLTNDGKMMVIEEKPFIFPRNNTFATFAPDILGMIQPKSPSQIKEIFVREGFIFLREETVRIDEKHNLFGLIFQKE